MYAAGALTGVSYKQDYGVSVLVFEDVPLSSWVTIFMIGGGGLSRRHQVREHQGFFTGSDPAGTGCAG